MQNITLLLNQHLGSYIFLPAILAFIAGVLTSFTPCVYPLIPITASVISSKTFGQKSLLKAFIATLIYIMGISLIYTSLGLFAAITGKIFGQISSNPIFYFLTALIMFILGLDMLDIINFSKFIPVKTANFTKYSGYLGLFIIGLNAGFIFAPCTAPALGAILTYIGNTQNIFIGGITMLAFSLGLSMLLLIIGTFSGLIYLLPKSGKWMIIIKKIIGIAILAGALYYLFLSF